MKVRKHSVRIVSILITFLLILSIIPFSVLSINADSLTSGADAIVSVALSEDQGFLGQNNKYTHWYGKINGSYSYAWCATFVAWCAEQAGISKSIIPKNPGCSTMGDFFRKQGVLYTPGNYTPVKGDIVFYTKGGGYCHVGIVLDYDKSKTNSLKTVEGNTSSGSHDDGCVAVKWRNPNFKSFKVAAYAHPKYNDGIIPVNIGDNFYAVISNTQNGKPIENQDDNVVLGTDEHSERQVWRFYLNDDRSYNIVSKCNGKALDLESYGNENGTNIKCYENTNNSAQRWFMCEKDGGYYLVPKCSLNGVMDLADNNSESGTNIQFWTYNGTSAQIYSIDKIDDIHSYLSKDIGDDFYGVILNKNHYKPIENREGNVVLATENHSENQVWHFTKNSDGSYNITSLFDSKAIDLSSYGNVNGTNIKVYENSNNDAQRWYLNEDSGGYTISPKCSPNGVMDLDDNSPEDGTNIQFWEYNGTLAQIYAIMKLDDMYGYLSIDLGTDYYCHIINAASGLRLTNADSNVEADSPENAKEQIWKLERQDDNSYLIRSCVDGTCLDSANGEFDDGNNVQTYEDNGTRAQRWYFIKHGDNKFTIKSQLANSLLDVFDSSFESGSNIQLWHPNDTNAQIFEIELCSEPIDIVVGDADGDGAVSALDVTYIQRAVAHLNTGINEDNLMNGDVDGSGVLEITDATYIQRHLAKMETPYAIGEKK